MAWKDGKRVDVVLHLERCIVQYKKVYAKRKNV